MGDVGVFRYLLGRLIRIYHIILVLFITTGWATKAYQAHMLACYLTCASWAAFGSCPLSRITNFIEGRPKNETLVWIVESKGYVTLALTAMFVPSYVRMVMDGVG